ncbi:MAG: hypothetical protein CMM93_03185 [Rickettsiales bacterium]|nr:hypothetical protein [Rickettsiales bacterium]
MSVEISRIQITKFCEDSYSFEIECVGGITLYLDDLSIEKTNTDNKFEIGEGRYSNFPKLYSDTGFAFGTFSENSMEYMKVLQNMVANKSYQYDGDLNIQFEICGQ